MLLEPDRDSVLDIALDCSFGSVTNADRQLRRIYGRLSHMRRFEYAGSQQPIGVFLNEKLGIPNFVLRLDERPLLFTFAE